jgi:uncharacterized membrane protein YbaN (DUF454 family)
MGIFLVFFPSLAVFLFGCWLWDRRQKRLAAPGGHWRGPVMIRLKRDA